MLFHIASTNNGLNVSGQHNISFVYPQRISSVRCFENRYVFGPVQSKFREDCSSFLRLSAEQQNSIDCVEYFMKKSPDAYSKLTEICSGIEQELIQVQFFVSPS